MIFTKQKENAASGFWRNPGTDPMISFQPADRVGHSDPKNKYHAINSVYYIFSIQVYITFLSIQVHIIIHIVLVCLLVCIFFIFKVLVNFGSQLLFFQFVKHSCNMSTLLCVGVTWEERVVVGVVAGWGPVSWRALGPWKSSTQKAGCFPTSGPKGKSLRGEARATPAATQLSA